MLPLATGSEHRNSAGSGKCSSQGLALSLTHVRMQLSKNNVDGISLHIAVKVVLIYNTYAGNVAAARWLMITHAFLHTAKYLESTAHFTVEE